MVHLVILQFATYYLLHLQIWCAQQVVLNTAWFKLMCYKSMRYSKFACIVFKVICVALLPCWNLSTHSKKILLIWYSTWFENQILSLRERSIKGWFGPMLVWYIGECMVIIININDGIKEYACGCQNSNMNQILIFDGYDKGERIFIFWVILWVKTILDHIDT